MLIKEGDDSSQVMAALEARATKPGAARSGAAADLAKRKAGYKGEAESTYLIDFDFAGSPNWAVLHDLRLVHGARTAQIDHLLINRWMEFFVLETKHFSAGIKITEDGEFLRFNKYTKGYEGMPSPLQQNERHIAVLSDVVATIELPSRFGMRIAPSFQSLILVAPSARIMRPDRLDTSRVIKADQLKPRIWQEVDSPNPLALLLKSAAKLVAAETVEFVGRQLAALHKPVGMHVSAPSAPRLDRKPARIEPTFQSEPAAKVAENITAAAPSSSSSEGPACKGCQGRDGEILYGRYGYYFKCSACAVNTAIRFTCQPDHQPRLRKHGATFHRDCPECGTSKQFHHNRGGGA